MTLGQHYWIAIIVALTMVSSSLAQPNYSSLSLATLNQSFRQAYANARQQELEEAGPIIIAKGDRLILLHTGRRINGTNVDVEYHDLKAVAHAPLALFCILKPSLDRPLNPSKAASLAKFQKALKDAKSELSTTFPERAVRKRQRRILKRCEAFVATVVEKGMADSAELDQLLDSLRIDIAQNVAGAARVRIDNYHRQMLAWRDQLTDDQFQQLRVIVPGASMPRKNNLTIAYFAKLFEQEGECEQIVYAESRFQDQEALKLLGTHILDRQIGTQFFDDESRMNRDLLGPEARVYLDSLDFEPLRGRLSTNDSSENSNSPAD